MSTANIQIQGAIIGTPTGTRAIGPLSLTSAAANGSVMQVILQSGQNVITTPTNPAPSGCIIVLPSANTAIVTLKGEDADVGIAIGKTTTQLLNWDSTAVPASFVLNSAATQTGLYTEIIFF